MRRLGAKTTAALASLGDLRARPLGILATIGGVLAVGTAILLSQGPTPIAKSKPGGETVISKFARVKTQTNLIFAEPTPVNRLLSMALAPMPTIAPPPSTEPNLAGLSEIPSELIWNRPPEKDADEKRKSFAAFSKVSEQLPWDAVEPVPFSPATDAAASAPRVGTKQGPANSAPSLVEVASSEIGKWLKAKVTEIKGSERSRPLYHFELWLEPPADVKGRLVGVSYTFSSPAVRPQAQASSDRATGFRISAGGLACADEIEISLRFDDGHVENVSVDGCKLLS